MMVWAASLWRFFLSLFFRFLLPLSLVLCKTSQRSTQNKYSIKQQVAFDTQTRCIHAHKPNHTLSCFFSLFLSLVLTYITATLKQQHLHCNTPNNNCRVMKSDDRDRQNKNKNEKGTATFHMSSQMSVKHTNWQLDNCFSQVQREVKHTWVSDTTAKNENGHSKGAKSAKSASLWVFVRA